MGKKISGIILLIVTFCFSFSCKEGENLQELIKEETRAISRYIDFNDINILYEDKGEYPKGKWPENTYFKTTDGLFFQVVDSGNGKKAQILDVISVRYDYMQFIKDVAQGDTTKYNFPIYSNYMSYPPPVGQPFNFTYGISLTYNQVNSPVCQAWVIPLTYVGEGAILNVIVPSLLGSAVDLRSITPIFYKNLRYTSFN